MDKAITNECARVQVNAWTIFKEFVRLSLMGFGGVLPFARQSIVERNHWLTDREFAEMLGVGQMLPGANVVNLGVMLGWRFARWRGVFAAFFGLLLFPVILLLFLAMLYQATSHNPVVHNAVVGMAAVAAGLILATGLKLAASQQKTIKLALLGSGVFIMVALFNWSLAFVLAGIIPLALLIEWFQSAHYREE